MVIIVSYSAWHNHSMYTSRTKPRIKHHKHQTPCIRHHPSCTEQQRLNMAHRAAFISQVQSDVCIQRQATPIVHWSTAQRSSHPSCTGAPHRAHHTHRAMEHRTALITPIVHWRTAPHSSHPSCTGASHSAHLTSTDRHPTSGNNTHRKPFSKDETRRTAPHTPRTPHLHGTTTALLVFTSTSGSW